MQAKVSPWRQEEAPAMIQAQWYEGEVDVEGEIEEGIKDNKFDGWRVGQLLRLARVEGKQVCVGDLISSVLDW